MLKRQLFLCTSMIRPSLHYTLCNCLVAEAQSTRNRRVIVTQSLCKCYANAFKIPTSSLRKCLDNIYAQTLRKSCGITITAREIAAQSQYYRRANATQSARYRCAIAAQSLQNYCAIAWKSLRNRSTIASE
jgi:hypothetical protein